MFDTLKGKRVLLTGHTGFKGAWLGYWLSRLGAEVTGFSLPPEPGPNLYAMLGNDIYAQSVYGDIRDIGSICKIAEAVRPDVVFHLAAQALVRRSYADPIETFSTNIMGTANVLEACRQLPSLPAIVCVTTDKVYENVEWTYPYRETDRLGGKDPYSASKAASELVIKAYREALYPITGSAARLSVARGGNVVGGGDWSEDRLVPDAIRAARAGEPLRLRCPDAVRPWQHVLELCHAYLTVAVGLLGENSERYADDWNFGPQADKALTVLDLAKLLKNELYTSHLTIELDPKPGVPEANYLTLDISKAGRKLGWHPVLPASKAIAWSGEWYESATDPQAARHITQAQLTSYIRLREQT